MGVATTLTPTITLFGFYDSGDAQYQGDPKIESGVSVPNQVWVDFKNAQISVSKIFTFAIPLTNPLVETGTFAFTVEFVRINHS